MGHLGVSSGNMNIEFGCFLRAYSIQNITESLRRMALSIAKSKEFFESVIINEEVCEIFHKLFDRGLKSQIIHGNINSIYQDFVGIV